MNVKIPTHYSQLKVSVNPVLFGCHLSEIVKELSNSKHKHTLENALLYKACLFQDEGLHPTCDLFVVFL